MLKLDPRDGSTGDPLANRIDNFWREREFSRWPEDLARRKT